MRNPFRTSIKVAREAARIDAKSAGAHAGVTVESGGIMLAGSYSSVTGELKPAGITGVTSTADPFYSARSS